MKTIYLRVDMPDYFVIDKDIDLMDYANHYIEFTEIQLPSDEKIESEIVDLFGKNDISVGIIAGIKAYKSKILKP